MLFVLFTNAYANVWDDFSSPVTNEDSQKVLLYGGGATLAVSLLKNTFVRKLQKNIYESQPLCCKLTTPGNTFLQILPNILYSFGFGFNYLLNNDEDSKRRAIGMVKTTLYADVIVEILKKSINERRPNGGGESFPSGHATSAFSFASYAASEHPWYIGVPAYAMASYVGFCRIQDNHHYLHNILAGATIGISYGIAISQNSRKDQTSKSALMIAPTDELKGVAFRYALEF